MAAQKGFNLLIPLIMAIVIAFLGIIGAVQFNSEVARKKEQLEKVKRKIDRLEKEKRDLIDRNVTLREFIKGSKDDSAVAVEELKRSQVKRAQELMSQTFKGEKNVDKKYDSLIDIYPDLFAEIEHLRQQVSAAKDQVKKIEKKYNAKVNSYSKLRSQNSQEIEKLQNQKESIQTDLTRTIQEREDERDKYKRQYEDAVREKELLRDNYEQVVIPKLETEIDNLKRNIRKLKETIRRRKKIDDLDPDGEIIAANQTLGYVWLNMGRVHGLRKGLIFKVFQYIKGGKRNFKGKVEVIRVDVDMAQARIIEQLYSNDPLIKGDYVISPIYDRNQKKHFVFAGQKARNRLYSREKYKKLLEAHNQEVEDHVTNRTDFVVLLDKYQQSKAYEDAKNFPWIIFLREEDLVEFVKK